MKSIYELALILLTIISLSCDDNLQTVQKEAFIQSVIVQDTVTARIPFEIEFEFSVSGCDTYFRFELEETEENLFLKVFINSQNSKNCLTGLFTEKIREEIEIETFGEKKLIINDSIIVKTIQVNQ